MGPGLRRASAGLLATLIAAAPAFALERADVSPELEQAQQLMDQKDWTAALVELKRALRKDRRNADVHILMGYSYRKSGQLDEAFDSYRAALRIDPDHKAAHEYIGEAYLQINQPERAREHLNALKRICGEACGEYRDLAKAVAAWRPPAGTAVATTRRAR
jgi:tetratricopeptide (TPR) repeat protein